MSALVYFRWMPKLLAVLQKDNHDDHRDDEKDDEKQDEAAFALATCFAR
jgi:hypothetical protein